MPDPMSEQQVEERVRLELTASELNHLHMAVATAAQTCEPCKKLEATLMKAVKENGAR